MQKCKIRAVYIIIILKFPIYSRTSNSGHLFGPSLSGRYWEVAAIRRFTKTIIWKECSSFVLNMWSKSSNNSFRQQSVKLGSHVRRFHRKSLRRFRRKTVYVDFAVGGTCESCHRKALRSLTVDKPISALTVRTLTANRKEQKSLFLTDNRKGRYSRFLN